MKNKELQIKTLTKNDLAVLAQGGLNGGFALSFYLGLNPGINFRSEVNSNLSKEAEKIKGDKEYSKSDKNKILKMLGLIKKEVSFLRSPKEARTLIFFLKESSKPIVYRVPVYIQSSIVIESDYFIDPLVKITQEFSRYLVAVIERDKAEFFSIFLGEIEKDSEILLSDVPKKIRTSTSDDWHGRREQKIERHIEDHLNRHFKAVALKIREHLEKNGYSHLILGGHQEARVKFQDFLDKNSAKKLVGFFNLSHYDHGMVKEKSMAIIKECEKVREEKIVKELLDSIGGKKWTAVAGIEAVLENLYLEKIKMFIIGKNYKKPGYVCKDCHRILLLPGECPSCEGKAEKTSDLADEIMEEAVKNKIEIRQLFYGHKNFDRFGIGAFLKNY